MTAPDGSTPLLQWNRAGWFGSLFGATAWMFALAVYLAVTGERAGALVVAGLAVVATAVGTFVWTRRATLRPYPSLQLLIAVCGICAAGAMLALDAMGVGLPQDQELHPSVLLIYPALMVMFHFQLRQARD